MRNCPHPGERWQHERGWTVTIIRLIEASPSVALVKLGANGLCHAVSSCNDQSHWCLYRCQPVSTAVSNLKLELNQVFPREYF